MTLGKRLVDAFKSRKKTIDDILKRKPYDIGRDADVADFMVAAEAPSSTFESLAIRLTGLAEGAAEALRAGKPEKMQAFFAGDFDKRRRDGYYLYLVVHRFTAQDVQSALSLMPPDKRQRALDDALCGWAASTQDEAAGHIRTLVCAGANPDAYNGKPLSDASTACMDANVKALYLLGADFDLAMQKARLDVTNGKSENTLVRLGLYQQMFTTKTRDERFMQAIEDLQKQVRTLTEKIDRLEGRNPPSESPPEPPAPTLQ